MDNNLKDLIKIKIENVISALEKNNMIGIYTPTCEDAVKEVEKLLKDGDTVSMGGTVSAKESGVADLIKSGKYTLLNIVLFKSEFILFAPSVIIYKSIRY